ncbi:MAG TPA: small-conductance mechanosensitive channel, partial [Anaerolineae bacterium]
MADLWQDRLFVWSIVLIVGFPLLVVVLTEAVERLNRQQHPLASSLRQVRNIVLPILAVLLIVRFILDYAETALITRLLASVFWIAVLVVSFRLFKHVLASPEESQPGWRDNIPSLLLQLPRALLALVIVYYILAGVW